MVGRFVGLDFFECFIGFLCLDCKFVCCVSFLFDEIVIGVFSCFDVGIGDQFDVGVVEIVGFFCFFEIVIDQGKVGWCCGLGDGY